MKNLYLLLICIIPLSTFCQWDSLPNRMYSDTLHFPFDYGVASGDPLPNGVIIWTRISAEENPNLSGVSWRMATDTSFRNIVQSGAVTASEKNNWTIKVDVSGLEPSTTYYYQFLDALDRKSATGRTKTAPAQGETIENLKVAITSCSSIYSGYFNAYRRIAERDDLDLWIHLGDYIYDYVDEDEQVRVPEPAPIDPQTKEEFWQRHRYYLLDPDLREVRQQQPIFALWDNHDFFKNNEDDLIGSLEAFYNYLPIRVPDSTNIKRIYRHLNYGDLLDIYLIDQELWRNKDTIPNTNERSLLGNEQYNWLTQVLSRSKSSAWRIIGNQKLFSNWAIDHIDFDLPFGNGEVADPSAWDGFPAERARLLTFLRMNNLDNNIVISGDIHLSVASDLVINPKDTIEYNGETGEGAIGVEFVPGSISRGNVDEVLGIAPNDGLNNLLTNLSYSGNQHQMYLELFQHGYGLLDVKPDSVIAQFIYSNKLEVSNKDSIWHSLIIKNGENHWQRLPGVISSIEKFDMQHPPIKIFPNPSKGIFNIHLLHYTSNNYKVEVYNLLGKQLKIEPAFNLSSDNIIVDLSSFKNGIYFLRLESHNFITSRNLLKL